MLLPLIGDLFATAFLYNGTPQVVAGLLGMPFPTPFAKPRGVGDSAARVKFVWGFANFLVGAFLLIEFPIGPGFNLEIGVMFLAAAALRLGSARRFGRVQAAKRALISERLAFK